MRNFVLLVFLFSLQACHVGEDYSSNFPLSDNDIKSNLELTETANIISPEWYKIFKDNVLNTLIQDALKQNLSLEQAKQRLRQSRYSYLINSTTTLPMVNASGEYEFSKASSNQDYAYDINAFKIGVDASWELDIWGKGQYISDQYYEMMQGAQYSIANLKVSITTEIVLNYVNLRAYQEKLRITKQNLTLQKEILDTVISQHKSGIADDLALNQAEYTVEITKASIPNLEYQIETYKNALAVLLGCTPDKLPVNLDVPQKNIVSTAFRFDTKKLNQLPLSVIRLRPDILVSEANIRKQNAAVNEAITNLYPDITLNATFGFISSSGHSLFNKDSQIYGYTPGFTVPIWNWKQLVNNIELQKSAKEEYVLNYNETVLMALTEIKNAISAVKQTYKANQFYLSSVSKMQRIFNLTQTKYKNGLSTFTDVATAEQNLLQAQLELIGNNAEILQNLAAFYKAVGGGYNFI